jgi:hypothetical protein
MQLKTLYSLKNTLNKITVSGEDNLSMLLACINTVEQMIEEERQNESHPNE